MKWAGAWLLVDVTDDRREPPALTPSHPSAKPTTDSAKRDLDWAARYVREMVPVARSPVAMAYLEVVRKMTGAAVRLADVLERDDEIGWHSAVYLNEPGEPERGIPPHPLHGQKLGAIIGVMTDAVTARATGAISRTYLGPDGLKVAKAKTLGRRPASSASRPTTKSRPDCSSPRASRPRSVRCGTVSARAGRPERLR